MNRIKFILTALIAVFLLTNNVKAQNIKAEKLVGKWLTENKELTIQIYTIDNKFFGRIVGFKGVTDKNEMFAKTDKNNPNDFFKDKPLMGKIVMNEVVFNGKDKWEGGTYYDAKTGKTIGCTLSMEPNNKLKIHWTGIDKPSYWIKEE